jgi:hypothetical protein
VLVASRILATSRTQKRCGRIWKTASGSADFGIDSLAAKVVQMFLIAWTLLSPQCFGRWIANTFVQEIVIVITTCW